MKAIGYYAAGSVDRDDALVDIELETPVATGHDLLVKVAAVSVNPVDYKILAGNFNIVSPLSFVSIFA